MSSSFFKSVLERSLPRPFPRPCGPFSLDLSCNVFPLYFGVGHSLFGSSAVAIGNSSTEATWEQFGHTPQEVAPPPQVPSSPKGRSGTGQRVLGSGPGRQGSRGTPSPVQGCDSAPLACLSVPYSLLPTSPLLGPLLSPCASLSLLFLKLYENTKHRSGSSESQSAQHCTQGWVLGFIYCESSV